MHKRVCHNYKSRYTYAVPLEIIWLTPLSKWNPYNLYMHEYRHRSDVSKNGRNGGFDNTHAYNGTSLNAYYLTPAEFFHPGEVNRDPADTARDTVGVLDQQGNVCLLYYSNSIRQMAKQISKSSPKGFKMSTYRHNHSLIK